MLFAGWLAGDEKLLALVDADVVILISIYEHRTGVLLVVLLCNTLVIARNNIGGGEKVKTIDVGYLVEYENKNELRVKIQDILDKPAATESNELNGKDYMETKLSVAKGIEKYEKFYQEGVKEYKKEILITSSAGLIGNHRYERYVTDD